MIPPIDATLISFPGTAEEALAVVSSSVSDIRPRAAPHRRERPEPRSATPEVPSPEPRAEPLDQPIDQWRGRYHGQALGRRPGASMSEASGRPKESRAAPVTGASGPLVSGLRRLASFRSQVMSDESVAMT